MRRTLTACRSGLSATAAVVLLAACGGSDGEESAPSESSARSSSAAASTGPADSDFCTEATEAYEQIQPAINESGDPAAVAPALQQAADGVRAIEAPPEISSDWAALGDGIEQFAQAFAEFDADDPASASAFQQRITELGSEVGASATNVRTYLAEECGFDPSATAPAAPTG
jgi:hypothetical protein